MLLFVLFIVHHSSVHFSHFNLLLLKPPDQLEINLARNNLMGNIGEDYPHLITGGAMVDQVQHLLS
jgi:hypothetical protein